jgi:hypothetical protein
LYQGRIVAIDRDRNQRIERVILVNVDIGFARRAEDPVDFCPDLFPDRKVAQRRFEDLAYRPCPPIGTWSRLAILNRRRTLTHPPVSPAKISRAFSF